MDHHQYTLKRGIRHRPTILYSAGTADDDDDDDVTQQTMSHFRLRLIELTYKVAQAQTGQRQGSPRRQERKRS